MSSSAAMQRPAVGLGIKAGKPSGKRQVEGGVGSKPTGYYGMLSMLSKGAAHDPQTVASLEAAATVAEKTAPTGKKKADSEGIHNVDHFMTPEAVPKHVGKMTAAGRFHAQVPRALKQQVAKEENHSAKKTSYSGVTNPDHQPPHIASGPVVTSHFGRRPPPMDKAPKVFSEDIAQRESVDPPGRRKEASTASVGATPGMDMSAANESATSIASAPAATISGAKPRGPSPFRHSSQLGGKLDWIEKVKEVNSAPPAQHWKKTLAETKRSPSVSSTVGALLGDRDSNKPRSYTPLGRRTTQVDYSQYVPDALPVRAPSAGDNSQRHSLPTPRPSQIFTKDPSAKGADSWDYKCICTYNTNPENVPRASRRRNSGSRTGELNGSSLAGLAGKSPEVNITSASSCGGDSIASSRGRAGIRSQTPDPSARFGRRRSLQPNTITGASPAPRATSVGAPPSAKRQFGRTSSSLGMLGWD